MAACTTTTPLTIPKGSSKTLRMTVRESNGITLVDLTGATVYLTIRRQVGATLELVYKSSSDVSEALVLTPQTGANLGKAEFYIVPADTTNLEPGTYYYDAWVELVTGERYVVIGPAPVLITEVVTKTFI